MAEQFQAVHSYRQTARQAETILGDFNDFTNVFKAIPHKACAVLP